MNELNIEDLRNLWYESIYPALVEFQKTLEEHTEAMKNLTEILIEKKF